MEPNEVNVKCSFCGKEVPCPKDMTNAEKHACFECFLKLQEELPEEEIKKVHVAIPKDKAVQFFNTALIKQIMEETFPEFWKDKKNELKEMSRREVAEHCFMIGAESMFAAMNDAMEEMEKEDERLNKEEAK